MLSAQQNKVLANITKTFKENKICFQITGGLAAITYGVNRSMYDIDIDVYKKDIQKIRSLFKKFITTDFHHAEDEYFDLYLLTLTINTIPVDIAPIEDAYFKNSKGKRITFNTNITHANNMQVFGLQLPIQNKNELIAYKKILGRDTDLLDVQKIIDTTFVLKEFQTIPGVGKSIASDLWDLGFRSVRELKNKNPEKMYNDFCTLKGMKIDRCMLYVFRCAVYFASNKNHNPHLLKWWNWKAML